MEGIVVMLTTQVSTRTEGTTFAAQQDNALLGNLSGSFHRIGNLTTHVGSQGVALMISINGDSDNRAVGFDADFRCWVRHSI